MNNDAIDKTQAFDDAAPAARPRRLQLLRAGTALFGVFADEIATIVAWRKPTPLPQAPKPVLGVVSVQGRMLTVLDLASLPTGETAPNESPGDLTNKTPSDDPNDSPGDTFGSLVALRGDEQLALAVANVGESIELLGEFDAQPANSKLVLGVLQRNGAPIKILNHKELFPTAIHGRERRRRRF